MSCQFLQRAVMLRVVLAIAFLSVHPSVTRRYYIEMNESAMMPSSQLCSRHGSITFMSVTTKLQLHLILPITITITITCTSN